MVACTMKRVYTSDLPAELSNNSKAITLMVMAPAVIARVRTFFSVGRGDLRSLLEPQPGRDNGCGESVAVDSGDREGYWYESSSFKLS